LNGKTSLIGTGAANSGGAAQIETIVTTEGVYRASPLGIAGSSEFVLEFDFTIHADSGNFYILYMEGSGSPYLSDIAIRAINPGAGNGDFGFQVDYASGGYEIFSGKTYDVPYEVTLHHKADNSIDLYLDSVLLNTYGDRNAGLGTNLVQFGDGSTGAGFGNMTIDNVSIGVIPEPTSLAAIGLLGMAALRRRR